MNSEHTWRILKNLLRQCACNSLNFDKDVYYTCIGCNVNIDKNVILTALHETESLGLNTKLHIWTQW